MSRAHPVDQLDAQVGMVDESLLQGGAELLRAEAAEVQGVVLAAGANVVGEQVVLGDLVALLGMVPEIAGVGDERALVVDQDVVDGDDAVVGVPGRRVLLEELEAAPVELIGVPLRVGEEAVEAGLVGDLGELAVDAQDGLVVGHEQAGQVFGKVAALRIVGEKRVEVPNGLAHDVGPLNDTRHGVPLAAAAPPCGYCTPAAAGQGISRFAKGQL